MTTRARLVRLENAVRCSRRGRLVVAWSVTGGFNYDGRFYRSTEDLVEAEHLEDAILYISNVEAWAPVLVDSGVCADAP